MAKYIEIDQANDVLINITALEGSELEEAVNAIWSIPAADVAPVRHGRYIIDDMGDSSCSECGAKWLDVTQNYCPHCGALLDGE